MAHHFFPQLQLEMPTDGVGTTRCYRPLTRDGLRRPWLDPKIMASCVDWTRVPKHSVLFGGGREGQVPS